MLLSPQENLTQQGDTVELQKHKVGLGLTARRILSWLSLSPGTLVCLSYKIGTTFLLGIVRGLTIT